MILVERNDFVYCVLGGGELAGEAEIVFEIVISDLFIIR